MKRDEGFDVALNSDEEVCAALRRLFGRDIEPSEVLAEVDPDMYGEQRAAWKSEIFTRALESGLPKPIAETNRERFNSLSELVARGSIVPFVGAGLSVPCGMPAWSDFLSSLGRRKRKKTAVDRLIRDGRYEDAASLVVDALGEGGFKEAWRSKFQLAREVCGPVAHLKKIAKRAVVTTNFDGVLEECFGNRLDPKLLGLESADFRPHFACGEQVLLKLHGDLSRPRSRILTASEYEEAYGPRTRIDFDRPIPRALRLLFTGSSLVFVGCSLGPDRSLRALEAVVEREGGVGTMPRHYAVLPWDRRRGASNRLTDLSIYPIWYDSSSGHEAVDVLLSYLAEEVAL